MKMNLPQWFEFTIEATKLSVDYDDESYSHDEDDPCHRCIIEKEMQKGCNCECHHEIYQQQTVLVCSKDEQSARKHLDFEEWNRSNEVVEIAEEKFTQRESFRNYMVEAPGDCDEISSGKISIIGIQGNEGDIFIGKVRTIYERWS
jgi:hypothetical protein